MTTLAIVVPCYNEEQRLNPSAFVEAVEKWPWISFCFVDDGSTDSTAEKLAHMVSLYPAFHAIYLSANVGKAEAVRTGMNHLCKNTHADYVGFWERTVRRGLIGNIAKFIIRRILDAPVWDTQCGAKVFSREVAEEIFHDRFRTRWLFDVELLMRLGKRLKTEVHECPLATWFDVPGSKVGLRTVGELLTFPILRLMHLL